MFPTEVLVANLAAVLVVIIAFWRSLQPMWGPDSRSSPRGCRYSRSTVDADASS
jgi:hypothetical protein